MPAIRVILMRLFPKVLGTIRTTSSAYYAKYGSASRSGARIGNSNASLGNDKGLEDGIDAIVCTRTLEVNSTVDLHRNETVPMQMDDLNQEGRKVSSTISQNGSDDISVPKHFLRAD